MESTGELGRRKVGGRSVMGVSGIATVRYFAWASFSPELYSCSSNTRPWLEGHHVTIYYDLGYPANPIWRRS